MLSKNTSHEARSVKSLTSKQKEFLNKLSKNLSSLKSHNRDKIQDVVLSTMKNSKYEPKDVFPGLYISLTGKEYGPKAADILLSFGIQKAIKLFKSK